MSKTLWKSREYAKSVVSLITKPKRVFCLITIIAMFSTSFVFSSCSVSDLTTESSEEFEEVSTSVSANNLKPEITVEQFITESILTKFNEITKGFYFDYERKSNDLVFDCSNFTNSLIGCVVCDLNNDGKDDILSVTLEKHNKDFDDQGEIDTVFINRTPYIYNNGKYIEKSGWANRIKVATNHQTIIFQFAIVDGMQDFKGLAESSAEDNDYMVYNEKYPPYYSVENSLGDYETMMSLTKYEDESFSTVLGYQERISHVSCMPEAEHISYFDTKNGESLFSSGVTGVTTGSDMPAPEFKYETSGKFESEEQAIEYINQSLKKYNMDKYMLKPYSWEDRYNNSLVLDEPKDKSCSFKIIGESIDENKSRCYIELL